MLEVKKRLDLCIVLILHQVYFGNNDKEKKSISSVVFSVNVKKLYSIEKELNVCLDKRYLFFNKEKQILLIH